MDAVLLIELQQRIRANVGVSLVSYTVTETDQLVYEIRHNGEMMARTTYDRVILESVTTALYIEREQAFRLERAIDWVLDRIDWSKFYVI